MAGSSFGNIFRITTWGESHGKGIGVVVDGCPAGLPLCEEDIQKFLDRRKPGQSKFTTQRNESDTVEIVSGIFEGKTTGTPISMMYGTRISILPITARLHPIIVRDMPITVLIKSMVSVTIAAADVLPVVKPSDALQAVRLQSKS